MSIYKQNLLHTSNESLSIREVYLFICVFIYSVFLKSVSTSFETHIKSFDRMS